MSGTSVSPIGLRFGAELEVVTGSRSNAHTNDDGWHLTAVELNEELRKKGIKNHVNHNHDKGAENYSEWSIIQETSVDSHQKSNICKSLLYSTQHYNLFIINFAQRGNGACLTHLRLPRPLQMEQANG